MGQRDPRIDAYIAKSAEFAQPILVRVRDWVHAACPDVEETMKWSMPTFMYAGGILAGMAAFKHHASFGYWKHALVMAPDGAASIDDAPPRDGMGSYGKMTSVRDLPPKKQFVADVRKAMRLNEEGVKTPQARKTAPKPPLQAPADLLAALKRNARAKATFEGFPPGQKREYIDWITEAKREETRVKRLEQAVAWMAEGKRRNWKYEHC